MEAAKKDLAIVIGSNIRKYRDKAGLTQAQLAEKIGVSNTFISRVELGAKLMKLEKLYTTALALNVGCDALLFSENNSIHMSNIQRMLAGCSPEFLSGMEDVIRECVNHFSEQDTQG